MNSVSAGIPSTALSPESPLTVSHAACQGAHETERTPSWLEGMLGMSHCMRDSGISRLSQIMESLNFRQTTLDLI